ncbi:regulation of nuclear pre-mRNA domain-containing protein 2a [Centropristis striata]|uniref:regulation of nuclear pre-mRNA domain-containing protein 2a n=1 Tax=Centropristis striata TaxID=184440 RepID=UPI0027E1088E|nr:regulation of nuclear pre-mRNA domain-containing protein 2a [Centropristis striata]
MAAGAGAASGSLESTLERRFKCVNNTMESIQGLSTWCIDNKKYHSLIVRHWMKCMRKCDASHRLNLFYVANDVIQTCKRKNAIVYRTAFAEILPEAFVLVNSEGDAKVMKSVERILSIWEERGVYSGTLITELRSSLVKEESPPETPVEQKTPVESKADLRSKVVAEFVPQALFDELAKYRKSMEELDLREKQLAAMRVDICSSDALKRLKDKAGGKKFSKDFEEGSAQLQEFVKFYDKQVKTVPPLMEALSNADIFYEMQYKEVKIVANAYQTFANRVSHLKRKLDSLKANLPDLDDSPIPSPSADAPSPTGSESPFHGLDMANPDPDLDGSAMDDEAEPPAPSPLSSLGGSPKRLESLGDIDNREVEDMELSDEEMDSGGIIVEEHVEHPTHPNECTSKMEPTVVTEAPVTQITQATPPVVTSAASAVVEVEGVDLGKIGSILNSLNSVMKKPGPLVESPPAAAPAGSSGKTTPAAAPVTSQDASSLVNLLSKVDVSPADLLGALSKVHGQGSFEGIPSLLSSPAANVSSDSSSTGKIPPSPASTSASAVPSQSPSLSTVAPVPSPHSSSVKQSTGSQVPPRTSNPASALVQALHRDMDLSTETNTSFSSQSLESKIHNFLQGNPAFNAFNAFGIGTSTNPGAGGDNLSPVIGTDTQSGTPVRDEGGGTPTQDEIMDKPVVVPFTDTNQSLIGDTIKKAPVAYQNSNNPQQHAHGQPGVAQNGQVYQPYHYGEHKMSEQGITAPVAHYQQISAQTGGPVPGERAPGSASSAQTIEGFQGVSERGWYGDTYPEGNSQQPRGYKVTAPGENKTSGLYPYQTENFQEPQELPPQQGANTAPGYFTSGLPPVPKLPPPPNVFDAPPARPRSMMMPPEQQPMQQPVPRELPGARGDSVISGMVVHDHQHKSMFHPDDSLYERDRLHPPQPSHPEDFHPHPDDLRYQDELHHHDPHFFEDDPYHHPDPDPYHRTGSPPHHHPGVREHLPHPFSPSEDSYYGQDYQQHSPPPRPFAPRRQLPPPQPMRHPGPRHPGPRHPGPQHPGPRHPGPQHPGPRPPHRPPHPAHHPHPPRGPPQRAPFPRFQQGPDPRLRAKRPGPRGGGNPGPMFPPKRPFLPPRY